LLLLFLILSCAGNKKETETIEPKVILPDGFTIDVKLAVSENEKALGLMFVSELPDNKGMFFINDYDQETPFWMKNCLINLDIIFLNENLTVVDIARNVPPCESEPCPYYFSSKPYRYVLEVRGNLASQHNLNPQDKIVAIGFLSDK
jgi:uncharacterized membrane protein (UPF0127 family)